MALLMDTYVDDLLEFIETLDMIASRLALQTKEDRS
jgi:hypothetical protein